MSLSAGDTFAATETPAPAEGKLTADGPALLRQWTPPEYPVAALKAKRSGMVTVRLIVDETGNVTQARAVDDPDVEFVEPALAAVRSWVFAPAIENGKEAACCLETLVMFSPALGQQKPSSNQIPPESQTFQLAPRVAPKPKFTPTGDYPDVLVERQFPGVAEFTAIVSPAGRVLQARITAASHADFVLGALASLNRWEFEPGWQGDLAVTASVEGRVTFDTIGGGPSDVLAANGISGPDGGAPAYMATPVFMADPVWPIELALKGEEGSATVAFTVTESGGVKDAQVKAATHPEFGYALVAAVETWGFTRPFAPNQRVTVAMEKQTVFEAIPLEATADTSPLARLVLALRANEIRGAKGLDEKLTPIYRVPPAYPAALRVSGRPAGRAEIEFVIDREGRARLPRIVSATHEQFGWAAATALAQWVFKVPRRAGEPVDVKARIPFDFQPPAE